MATHWRTLTALLALILVSCGGPSKRPEASPIPNGVNPATSSQDVSPELPGPAAIIAELINPQKLATLGPRGANPRIQKAVFWLEMARRDGQDITNIVTLAVTHAGYTNALAAQLTGEALLRNWKIAEGYGCFDADGLSEMRQGTTAPFSVSAFQRFSICPVAWTTSSRAPCAPSY